jgi:hypothetical protein
MHEFIDLIEQSSSDLRDLARDEGLSGYGSMTKREMVEALGDLSGEEQQLLYAETAPRFKDTDLTWSKAIYEITKQMDISGRGSMTTPERVAAILERSAQASERGEPEGNSSEESSSEGDQPEEDPPEKSPPEKKSSVAIPRASSGVALADHLRQLSPEERSYREVELYKAIDAAARRVKEGKSVAIFESEKDSDPEGMFFLRGLYEGWPEGNLPVAVFTAYPHAVPPAAE